MYRAIKNSIKPAAIILTMTLLFSCRDKQSGENYSWHNVRYGGGGFVDGIVFHPSEKGLCYCRTDMGGAYRRDSLTMEWIPLLDWLSYADANLMGVESIALDPSDPDKLYLACGTYTRPAAPDGAILYSSDRGKHFKRTNVPFKMGANEDGRGNGERMAVDPLDGSVIYLGTRHAGLWRSEDAAGSWNRVENFPDVEEKVPEPMPGENQRFRRPVTGSGIIFVLFVPGDKDSTETIYAGVSLSKRDNLFMSRDNGESWQAVPGHPQAFRPTHAALASDGIMYISYGNSPGPSAMSDGAVWKHDTHTGDWSDITPDRPAPPERAFGYAAVAVDPSNPARLLASSFNRYRIDNGEDIFYSTDRGQSWKQIFKGGGKTIAGCAPYTVHTGIHWLFDLEIDPFNPDHALFTTGYGGHETFNLSDTDKNLPTLWPNMSAGIEETVPLDLLSPPEGAILVSAIGDYGGAVHFDLNQSPPDNFSSPRFGNTNSVACAWKNPDIMVRAGRPTGDNSGQSFGYSLDGGQSWEPAASLPDSNALLGQVAVSANGAVWYWTPDPVWTRSGNRRTEKILPVFRTTDRGHSWNTCVGADPGIRIIADPENPLKAYGMDLFKGILYQTDDSGETFSLRPLLLEGGLPVKEGSRGDSRGGQDRIYAAPGRERDLWIAAFDGLYHLASYEDYFDKLPGVEEIHGFGFGKEAPGEEYPALYLAGTIRGQRGIFRSDDAARHWVMISDEKHQYGLILHVTGDPKTYGRVYLGTHGRGTIYGDPANE